METCDMFAVPTYVRLDKTQIEVDVDLSPHMKLRIDEYRNFE